MLAPRRVPPCFTASVAPLNTRRKDTGPDARPPWTRRGRPWAAAARTRSPVPPPDLWMMAAALTESKISSMESPTGST